MANSNSKKLIVPDPWGQLKQYTSARIALGRSGGSTPTSACLDFKLAHARARDAVHEHFEINHLAAEIQILGIDTLLVNTQACDRTTFLKRPDLGRRLDNVSENLIKQHAHRYDLVILVSDGLSALAAHRQTKTVLMKLLPTLLEAGWALAPIVLARFGRVALQDPVGELLNANIALILLGERPGLGSPDSLGAYFVFSPRSGNTDAQRNCVSNIRPEGLSPSAAADTLYYLLSQAKSRGFSGIELKDDRTLALDSEHSTPAER